MNTNLFSGFERSMYDTSPDLSNSIWATCSVIFASIGTFSIISNLAIVVIYMRKPSVSKSEILLTIIQLNFSESIFKTTSLFVN